jgi:hypothetical protein
MIRPAFDANGNRAHAAVEPSLGAEVVEPLLDQKAHGPRAGGAEDGRIEQGDVIGDEQEGAAAGQAPSHRHPQPAPAEWPEEDLDEPVEGVAGGHRARCILWKRMK